MREYLLRVDANRPKHIDDYIDYFGNGRGPDRLPREDTSWGDGDGAGGVSQWPRP